MDVFLLCAFVGVCLLLAVDFLHDKIKSVRLLLEKIDTDIQDFMNEIHR